MVHDDSHICKLIRKYFMFKIHFLAARTIAGCSGRATKHIRLEEEGNLFWIVLSYACLKNYLCLYACNECGMFYVRFWLEGFTAHSILQTNILCHWDTKCQNSKYHGDEIKKMSMQSSRKMSDNFSYFLLKTWSHLAKAVLGPVVQSIVTLMSLLRGQLIKCFTTLHCKSVLHFFNKK